MEAEKSHESSPLLNNPPSSYKLRIERAYPADTQTAVSKRQIQLQGWKESETNRESAVIKPTRLQTHVKFSQGNLVFLSAVRSGDVEEVERFLQEGFDVDSINEDGLTGLHQSCLDDDFEMVKTLVKHGANVDAVDKDGWSPLHAAASCGHEHIVRFLLENNARADLISNEREMPIDLAEEYEITELLSSHMEANKIDPDAARNNEEARMLEDVNKLRNDPSLIPPVSHGGATFLHIAAAKNYVKLLNIMLNMNKVDVNTVDDDGWTPLHAAVYWKCSEAAKLLMSNGADVTCTTKAGETVEDLVDPSCEEILSSVINPYRELIKKSSSSLETIDVQPRTIRSKPGKRVSYSVVTNPRAKSYQWYFKEKLISMDDNDYEGSTTSHLSIRRCLSKHSGTYKCVVMDKFSELCASETATLTLEGTKIEEREARLLGGILKKAGVNYVKHGIDVEELIEGKGNSTYEDLEVVLEEDPSTQMLATNLQQKLTSRLEEEDLYKEAIANDQKVSLSYTKILALGPGQVGRSTFLYRLMGLMKGNILTSDPPTQSQMSTGVTELREACTRHTSRAGALTTDKEWQVFEENSELEIQLNGLMSLVCDQAEDETPTTQEESDSGSDSDSETDSPSTVSIPSSNTSWFEKYVLDTIILVIQLFLLIPGLLILPLLQLFYQSEGNHQVSNSRKQTKDQGAKKRQKYRTSQNYCSKHLFESDLDVVTKKFKRLEADCTKFSRKKPKPSILFNVVDVGRQSAFLEMVPSLTNGPALYLVFIKMPEGLKTRYPVTFEYKNERGKTPCKNHIYTSEEVILTALSSIASFGTHYEEIELFISTNSSGETPGTPHNSLIQLVGTFYDQLKDEEVVESIESRFKEHVQGIDFYDDGLLSTTELLRVNNVSAKEGEIDQQRNHIETLLQTRFWKYQIPARWIMLSVCLKLLAKELNTSEVPFSDCVKLGQQMFGMSEKMVRAALKFLHKYIGLIMYFPNHERLKNVVICDPQIVFSSVSELIFNIYDPSKHQIVKVRYDDFVQTGRFSPRDITVGKDNTENKKLLSIATLIDLLVHLNIAAEVPPQHLDSNISEVLEDRKEYFLPAVLQTAENSILEFNRGENEEVMPEPLCIHFKTGYLPLGFVCALSAKLVTENEFQIVPYKVRSKKGNQLIAYKNKMMFRFDDIVNVEMISCSKYCEFRISRYSDGRCTAEFWDSDCCPRIKKAVCEAANKVIESMQQGSLYKISKGYELAFKCPKHQNSETGHEPLAKLVYDDSVTDISDSHRAPTMLRCLSKACGTSSLSEEMWIWFGKLEIVKQPSVEDDVIRLEVCGTKPITYQWFKNDMKLKDGDEYKGSTEKELLVRKVSEDSRGAYYCKVKDKLGMEKDSGEVKFDPFMAELKSEGLEKEEIEKLISKGYKRRKDLKHLNDLSELALEPGEKSRLKEFLKISEWHSDDVPDSSGSVPKLKILKDVFWDVRAHWYLLGIQLDVEHSDLEEARRETDVYDQYISMLKSYIKRQKPKPSWSDIVQALQSPFVDCPDLRQTNLPQQVLDEVKAGQHRSIRLAGESKSKAARLKLVLNALWEVRADWERIADQLISPGSREAIKKDHSRVNECFASLLHEHFRSSQDPKLKRLQEALKSDPVGKAVFADELEKMVEEGALW